MQKQIAMIQLEQGCAMQLDEVKIASPSRCTNGNYQRQFQFLQVFPTRQRIYQGHNMINDLLIQVDKFGQRQSMQERKQATLCTLPQPSPRKQNSTNYGQEHKSKKQPTKLSIPSDFDDASRAYVPMVPRAMRQ